jgi:hypothetical protein
MLSYVLHHYFCSLAKCVVPRTDIYWNPFAESPMHQGSRTDVLCVVSIVSQFLQ